MCATNAPEALSVRRLGVRGVASLGSTELVESSEERVGGDGDRGENDGVSVIELPR
jgi:hypothetical protein